MRRAACLLSLVLLVSVSGLARADGEWVLERSTVAYHVSHPLHDTDGVSHAARGKAVCKDGRCDVLVAAPVKSFDSGDSNRDVHMLQTVQGAQFPLVTVRFRVPESARGEIRCDLEIELAGRTARYKDVAFQSAASGGMVTVSGRIPATLSDFKIPPPSLLSVAVKNDMPVRVETTWRKK
jgi:hypothetical protein